MQSKIKRQELINIINQTDMLEKMSRPLLEQLCKAFKVEDSSTDNMGLIKQLKVKILDIFIQEGDGYLDYLHLPKFKFLVHDLSQKMFSIFKHVWNEYQKFKSKQHVLATKRTIEQLMPNFTSLEEIETFHLKLFQLYKSSDLCPKKNSQTNVSNTDRTQSKRASQHQIVGNFLFHPDNRSNSSNKNPLIMQPMQNLPMMNIGNIPQTLYYNYPFPPSVNFPKIQATDNNPYIIQNKDANNINPNMFDYQRYGIPPHLNPYYPNNPNMDFYHEQKPIKEPKSQIPPEKKPEPRSIFSQDFTNVMNQFVMYKFIQCPCHGSLYQQDKKIFKCSQCEFQYHYACLMIPVSKEQSTTICPLCILRKQTIYCKVQKQPIKFNWHLNQKGKELKVQMTKEESHIVYEAKKKGFNCQIRFLKIDGSSLKKQKKTLPSQYANTNANGLFHIKPKYTEITLPELNDINCQPISLEILLKSQDQAAQYNNPRLYLFAVFLITIKKIDDIINELFSSDQYTDVSFYNQYFADINKKLQISLQGQQFARGQIKYPVRGSNCKHYEVFDLKNYLGFIQDLKNQTDEFSCPIDGCSGIFTSFKYDKLIFQAISTYPQYNNSQPQGIQISKSGQFSWIGTQSKNDVEQQVNGMTGNINDLDMNQSQSMQHQQQVQDDQI